MNIPLLLFIIAITILAMIWLFKREYTTCLILLIIAIQLLSLESEVPWTLLLLTSILLYVVVAVSVAINNTNKCLDPYIIPLYLLAIFIILAYIYVDFTTFFDDAISTTKVIGAVITILALVVSLWSMNLNIILSTSIATLVYFFLSFR